MYFPILIMGVFIGAAPATTTLKRRGSGRAERSDKYRAINFVQLVCSTINDIEFVIMVDSDSRQLAKYWIGSVAIRRFIVTPEVIDVTVPAGSIFLTDPCDSVTNRADAPKLEILALM
jgi:hypothetical protein